MLLSFLLCCISLLKWEPFSFLSSHKMRAPFSPSEEQLYLQNDVFLALQYELCFLVTTKETDSAQWSNAKQLFFFNKFHYSWHHYYYIPNIQAPELKKIKCRFFFHAKTSSRLHKLTCWSLAPKNIIIQVTPNTFTQWPSWWAWDAWSQSSKAWS